MDLIQTICLLAGLAVFAPMIYMRQGLLVLEQGKQLKPYMNNAGNITRQVI